MRFAILVFFFCAPAFAVVVKDCPQKIKMNLNSINLDALTPPYSTDDNDCWYDCYNEPGLSRAMNLLEQYNAITIELELTLARSAVCNYKGKLDSSPVYAKIEGSFRPNATKKATLVTYWNSLVMYTSLGEMNPAFIAPLSPVTGLYYNGEYCDWGECVPNHIRLGLANSTDLKAL
jgi:hypothetical protein